MKPKYADYVDNFTKKNICLICGNLVTITSKNDVCPECKGRDER